MVLRYGSVCSGIEAVSQAWEPLGMEPAWFAEVDPFCSAVLAHRWPGVPNLGDILAADFIERANACGPIDILVGGTPCQSFSTAGKRGGMHDKRGGLTLRFLQIAEEVGPAWIVWENVPGVLSSGGGRDFGAVLGKMVQLGYGVCYRVLDSLGLGVPQRRRRVFVVGRAGGGCPGEVLFEQEGEGRDPAAGGCEGQEPAAPAQAGPGGLTPQVVDVYNQSLSPHCPTLWAGQKGHTGSPFAVLCHESGQGWWNQAEHSGPLRAEGENRPSRPTHVVIQPPTPIDMRQASRGGKVTNKRGEGSSGGPPGTGIGNPGDPAYTVSERGQAVAMPVLAFDSKKDGCDAAEHSPTLRAMNHDASWLNGGGQVGVLAWGICSDAVDRSGEGDGTAAQRSGLGITEGYAPSLRARPNNAVAATFRKGSENPKAGLQYAEDVSLPVTTVSSDLVLHWKSIVRRLTPRECERLQGMADDHTLVPWRGKPAPDSQRYRVIGNSMAVPVLAWIGRRLLKAANAAAPA